MTAPLRTRSSRAAAGAAIAAGATLAAPIALTAPAGAATARRPSAHAIVHRAAVEVGSARALVLTGTLRLGHGRFGFRVEASRHGKDARGSLLSRTPQLGFVGRMHFIVHGSTVYVHAGAPFWARQARKGLGKLTAAQRKKATRMLANRWVEMTGTSAHDMEASLGRLTHPAAFARTLLSAKTLGALHEGRPTHFRHQRALPITASKGGTLYVDTHGTTRPIALVARARSKATGGTVLFGYPGRLAVPSPGHARTVGEVISAVRH